MKNLLLIALLFYTITGFAQTATNPTHTAMHEICVNKKISLVIYLVLDSSETVGGVINPTLTSQLTPTIAMLVNELNRNFGRICVTFQNCSTVYIPVFPYGNWYKNTPPIQDSTEFLVTRNWYTEKTLNIYFVDAVMTSNLSENGDTYYPTPTNLAAPYRDFIVLEKSLLYSHYWPQAMHFFGHYFGLKHTDAEITNPGYAGPSQELVDGSNCQTKGDGFCDTEADNPNSTTDANGAFYVYPYDNYMSGYNTKTRFTLEQYNYMANTIMNDRLYLH